MDWSWLVAVLILLMVIIFVAFIAFRFSLQFRSLPDSSNGIALSGLMSPCSTDADCPTNFSCDSYNSTCKYQDGQKCRSAAQCLIGSDCANICVTPGSGKFNSPCPCGGNTSCVTSYEVAICKYVAGVACTSDEDCVSFSCVSGVCAAATPDGYSCNSDADCSSNSECSGGFCQPMGVATGVSSASCVTSQCTGSQRQGATCSVGTCLCTDDVGICGTPSFLSGTCPNSSSCYSDFSCFSGECSLNPNDPSAIESYNTCPPNAFRFQNVGSSAYCVTNPGFTCISDADCASGACQGGKNMASFYNISGVAVANSPLPKNVTRIDISLFGGQGFNTTQTALPYPQYTLGSPLQSSSYFNWLRNGGTYILFSDSVATALFYYTSTSNLQSTALWDAPIATLVSANYFQNDAYVAYLNQNMPSNLTGVQATEVVATSFMGDTNTLTFFASNFTGEGFLQGNDYNLVALFRTTGGQYILATIGYIYKSGIQLQDSTTANVFNFVDGTNVKDDTAFPYLMYYTSGAPAFISDIVGLSTSGPYFLVWTATTLYITGYLYPNQSNQESFDDWYYIYYVPGLFGAFGVQTPFNGNKAKISYTGSNTFSLAYSAGENQIVVLNCSYQGSLDVVTTYKQTVLIPQLYTLVDFDFFHVNNGPAYSLLCRVILKQSTSPDSILLLLANGEIIVMPGKVSDNNSFSIGLDYATVFGATACS